ncbi:MAG: Protective antigen [Candidatus Ordinivivax streblomastigis]|uniref:Protective antigen n=1 Tax=Candidatus Ordinivivax streblomastigis TaxID=2540710 RepID=A0A5M8P3D4_9BACT|nr:MAG: Protective antigen [Candidatus Ordinivivax streblomastigis]
MKKILFTTVTILASLAFMQAQQPITRVEGSPYPASAAPDRLYLTSESFGYSQKITLQSLQGMLARTKPEILRDTHGHANTLSEHVTIDRTYYNNFNGLLARYAGRFDGYILCEARTSSVNVAFSLCPLLNAIAVPADIEQAAINAGYTKVLDVRGKDETWALANYGSQFSKTIASYQNVSDDRGLFVGDYSVFAGALQFWDASTTGALANSVYNRMDSCAVYFGWGAGEYNTVEQLSKKSAMIHPSDWSPNLSTLSNIPAKIPRQKVQQTEYKVVPNVHTVCFVITDGDNIQWLSGSLDNANNWANPDKARVKLGWTISPSFVELAPALYKKYVENALTTENARNYLVSGPSGVGYYFPSIYPKLTEQSQLMNRVLKKADLNIVNIIDADGNHNPDKYLEQSNVDALFYYSYGGQYTKLAGQIKWYKDKPSIGGRFTLWGNTDDSSAETRNRVAQSLANTLNTQSTNVNSESGYSLIPVHIWTMNVSDVLNCITKLNPNVRVVSPDEFVWLIRKNIRTRISIADGNGLRAEYALLSNPESVILTTGEPTVDFDDEYLTEGTQAVGSNSFIARWTGKVQPIYSQQYTFHSTAAGGAMLKINGRILCDSLQNATVKSADTITLEAGNRYDLEFVYKKTGSKALATLEWESSSQVLQRIPRYQLFSRPMPSIGPVTAFDELNYGGYSGELKLGNYDSSALNKAGFAPATIQSLKVSTGFKVVLYSGNNFAGDSLVVTADNANLGAWQDLTVSLKVASNGFPLPEGIYYIKPKEVDYVVGIDGGYKNTDDGQKARLVRNTGSVNLQFRFSKLDDGVYRIEPMSSGKSLEIADFSKNDGANIQQWRGSDAENQKFIVVPTAEEGIYKILSCYSGKIIEAASLSSQALICQRSDENQATALWQLVAVPPLPDGNGNGLTGAYYNGLNFGILCDTRIDPTINFDWGTGKPNPKTNADNVSVRWQGKIEPRVDDEYTFYVNSDNGRRLWINDQLIIDKWIDDYGIEYSGTITLQAGQRYTIKLEYFESTGGAYCRLEWLSTRQPREIVPRSQLYSLDYSGIENPKASDYFAIYPNPAQGEIGITGNEIRNGSIVQISDISGRIIKTQRLNVSENRMDISNVPAGIYFVSLQGSNRESVKKLIIK